MHKAVNTTLGGFFLLLADLRIQQVDVLPDTAGYALVLLGLFWLSRLDPHFRRPFQFSIAWVTIILLDYSEFGGTSAQAVLPTLRGLSYCVFLWLLGTATYQAALKRHMKAEAEKAYALRVRLALAQLFVYLLGAVVSAQGPFHGILALTVTASMLIGLILFLIYVIKLLMILNRLGQFENDASPAPAEKLLW